jgi:hypothetical protein
LASLAAYDRSVDREFRHWVRAAFEPSLRQIAFELPYRIGLLPNRPWRTWTAVFHTPVMRSLPYLVAEAAPVLERRWLVPLGVANILIVFLAFFDDRLNDGQMPFGREENLVRRGMEAEVQARLAEAVGARRDFWQIFRRAFRDYADAHSAEPSLWAGALTAYDHRRYARDSAAKIAIGKLPALAAAMLGGLSASQISRLSHLIDHCMIALQYADDVTDYDDDFREGRCTFFVLRHLGPGERPKSSRITRTELRTRVATSPAAEEFLRQAGRHYTACLRLLDEFAMPTFRSWVNERLAVLQADIRARRRWRRRSQQLLTDGLKECWLGSTPVR